MRVLVFGASSTEGFWDSEGGWVARLRRYHDLKKITEPSQETAWVSNLGISGDTVDDILGRFDNEVKVRLKESANCAIVISIGGNDSSLYAGKEKINFEQYVKSSELLIEKAREYSSRILFVGQTICDEKITTPVPWGDIYVTNERRVLYENGLKNVCVRHKIPFIDIFEPFMNETQKGKELLFDGVHPNNDGHQLIFELVQPELDKLLRS